MQTTEFNQDPNEIKIDFNINSEIDFDDIDFKPLNEGLGFHQDRLEDKIKLNSLQRKKELRQIQRPARPSDRSLREKKRQPQKSSPTVNQDLLSSFYNVDTRAASEKNVKEVKTKKEFKFKMPTIYSQFAAFVIDLTIVLAITAATSALFVWASGLGYKFFLNTFSKIDMLTYVGPLFVVYFLSYFTMIETSQSIGKSVLKIETLDISGKRPSLKQCFTRALITLTSSLALFLPLAMDFQDRLSETKLHQK